MLARYLTMTSDKLITHKPELQNKITKRLLDIDNIRHDRDTKGLIWGDIIDALSVNFENSEHKEEIIAFTKRQLDNKSPSTVKKAKTFLKAQNLLA